MTGDQPGPGPGPGGGHQADGGASGPDHPRQAGGGAGERHAAGMTVRRQVLGDAHVDAARARTDGFTADFQDFITRYAWGEIWTRPGLDRRTRSCITLAMLAALHCDGELAMHVRAALRNGLTPEEIKEVFLQVAVYAGVPAANTAFAVAQRVLGEEPARDGPAHTEPAHTEPAHAEPAPVQPAPAERAGRPAGAAVVSEAATRPDGRSAGARAPASGR